MSRFALLLALLLAGCGGTGGAAPSQTPTVKDPVSVSVVRSGGIAGVKTTISVDPTGKWTREDQAGSTKSGRLTLENSQKLQRLAVDPRLAAEAAAPTKPTKCADAFNFQVTAGKVVVMYTDCPSDAAQPAVASEIVDLLESSTSY